MPSPSASRTSTETGRTPISESSSWPCTRPSSRPSRTCCGRTPMSRINSALALVLALAVAAPLFADEERYEQTINRDMKYTGGVVTIDHRMGALTVRTHNSNTVSLRAVIRSSDAEIGRQIKVHTSEKGSTIRTEFPRIINYRGNLSYSVEMSVTVPANAPVHAKNQFGN